MGATRNTTLSLAALAIFAFCGLAGAAAEAQETREDTRFAIDFQGFLGLSEEVIAYRAERLVSLETFNEMKAEEDTIILDTRSADAFARGHIAGAVHLNFSDFTDEKLAEAIPSRDTRILIYCNNNFEDDVEPVLLKSSPLALNVPTFVNLVGYGYDNVYELGELVRLDDPAVAWATLDAVS
ncbi:MAG: rhodanese-like domain-containing protein [Pseudomonadota bacterium]